MTRGELPEEKRTRCEVWTRVMGYHRPVSGWNEGKKAEFKERKYFVEAKIGQFGNTEYLTKSSY